MGWNATFSMAVGGMIGGGIFSVLGVVVAIAGSWAWASFVLGGAVAFVTALSYIRLAERFGEGGGAFTFLSRLSHRSLAGSLSWLLIAGYVLTTAVYAFTFGHYLSNVVGGGGLLAVGIMATLAAVNVRASATPPPSRSSPWPRVACRFAAWTRRMNTRASKPATRPTTAAPPRSTRLNGGWPATGRIGSVPTSAAKVT